jgi:putative flippase GtrA
MITRAFKYGIVGGLCALIDFLVFALFATVLEVNYLIAATLSFLVSTLANYVLSIRFVFASGARFKKRRHEASLVLGVSAVGYLFNIGTLFMCVEYLFVHPLLAKIIASGSAFGWNFGARQFFIFREPAPAGATRG